MQRILKTTVTSLVALAFLAMVGMCCCAFKAQAASQKVSCDHCASKQAPVGHECCLAKLVPMDAAVHHLSLYSPLFLVFFAAPLAFIALRAQVTLENVYVTGPPGLLSAVPLYLQYHSLRI